MKGASQSDEGLMQALIRSDGFTGKIRDANWDINSTIISIGFVLRRRPPHQSIRAEQSRLSGVPTETADVFTAATSVISSGSGRKGSAGIATRLAFKCGRHDQVLFLQRADGN